MRTKCIGVAVALFATGCTNIPTSPEEAVAQTTATRNRIEAVVDTAGEGKDTRAINQICERMRVGNLYRNFGSKEMLDAWAILCQKRLALPLPVKNDLEAPPPAGVEPTLREQGVPDALLTPDGTKLSPEAMRMIQQFQSQDQ